MKLSSDKKSLSFKPWAFLLVLAFSNAVLSSAGLSPWIKVTVFLAGILLPLFLLCRGPYSGNPKKDTLWTVEFLDPIRPSLWIALLFIALFLRFYGLETLSPWPNRDEGLHGMFAIGLDEKWSWKFFYTFGQHPPLLIWLLSFFFRWFQSPFLSLWLPPALVSALTLPPAYLALRSAFSKSLSFVGICLLGFSLWPWYCGRWCQQGILIPPWEFLCLFLTSLFLKEKNYSQKLKWAALLGLTAGLGSFLFTIWPFTVLILLLALFAGTFNQPLRNKISLLPFFVFFFLALIPFFMAVGREHYGGHIWSVSVVSGWFSLKHQAITVLSYFAALFWGNWEGDSMYTADSGGMLNPLWGAAFFLGLVRLWKHRSQPLALWVAAAILIGLAPGLLSMNVELFRAVTVLPFLLLVTALGIAELLSSLPKSRRTGLFLAALALCAGWDAYRFVQFRLEPEVFSAHWSQAAVSLEDRRAYGVLKAVSDKWGPGWVFTEFADTPFDETPFVTAYGFNAAENPALRAQDPHWAAVLTNVHYGIFLAPRFPKAHWYQLGGGLSGGEEKLLGVIPMEEKLRPVLANWEEAHHYFRGLSLAINNIAEDKAYETAAQDFGQAPVFLQKDRFLEACYWERRAEFLYYYKYQLHYDDQLAALQSAIQKGYPAEHLYLKLGSLYLRHKNFSGAERAFRAAIRAEPGNEEALSALALVSRLKDGLSGPGR